MAPPHKKSADYSIPSGKDHERISALFLGPKAENAELLKHCFDLIVSKQKEGREGYFPNDQVSGIAVYAISNLIPVA